jgi:hypothetical protein
VWAGDRVFLEVDRFDRDGTEHRRGVVPLWAADAEFVGSAMDRWSTTTAALARSGLLTDADHREVRWLGVFGDLIANTDMHPANLSLWTDGLAVAGVAPSYDMLPMAYALRAGELFDVAFDPKVPAPSDGDVARSAMEAAVAFWTEVAERDDVSADFRAIASANASKVAALAPAIARLPT